MTYKKMTHSSYGLI